ncbi:serologically defined colon cancer antigen 1 [Trichoderma cornu-damae]|uniref:Ribosome quality control complex subunit 2 n=1 Tax=Trichoderma cornu-damae TaxID=654480 RepID=A0A9P8QKA7_9HYPO|nr:serologically defined colon cancer antigen 1 [Trichoderma cornu-damae]
MPHGNQDEFLTKLHISASVSPQNANASMKQRFSSLDVKVIAHELQGSLVTLRLANVYDLSSKILLLKFAKPDNKQQLLVDNGFRCHLTDFSRTTAAAPSAFVARLRKYLKTRRLTAVTQVGTDRILEFQFSDGQYRMFLEFFASGNIILTDADLKILAISRNVSEGDGQEPQRVGLQYSLENRQNFGGAPALTKERVRDALKTAAEKAEASAVAGAFSGKKAKGKSGGDLRKALAVSITELPPVLVENILQANRFDVSTKPADVLGNESLLDALVGHLSEARGVVENITASATCTGYIFARKKATPSSGPDEADETRKREGLLYEDFHPFVPQKFKDDPSVQVLEFEGYNRTVDEFFSSLEGQKLESRLSGREEAAKKKLEAARHEQAKRIQGLQDAQAMNLRKAAAIEANVERVQEAMDAVNGLLAQGMDWVDIGKLVEREKKRQNPVAEIISLPLKLSENTITLLLAEEEFDEDEAGEDDPFETDDSDSEEERSEANALAKDGKSDKLLTVDIVLSASPWSNAREYYEERRSAAMKQEKTQLQATKALKSAEQKIAEDLKKGLKQEKALLQPIRKQMWFEKFMWFISSDGYLVLGGKDPQQSEMLYRRYLRKGDVYCHADVRGAANMVIKNNPNTPDAPIPPATLSQAGSLAVCSSDAWDSKAGMGAWWVSADQVSKSTPSGEIMPAGNFTIEGKKNYLPPTQLLLGLGFVFKISEQSKNKHLKHRIHDERSSMALEGAAAGEDELRNAEEVDDAEDSDVDSEENNPSNGKRANPLQGSGDEGEAVDDARDELAAVKMSDDRPANDETATPPVDAIEAGPEAGPGEGANEADAAADGEEDGSEEDGPAPSEPATEVSEAPTGASDAASYTARASEATGKGHQKRGQKGKARKIAQKYKGQDEEDRAAAEALIGAAVGRQRAEAEAAARAQRQAELEATKERRRAQHERKQREVAEQEEIRRAVMKEGLDEPEPDEAEKATNLDTLVGTPLAGDEIIEVIPVCAPWNALVRFKYKVKMQPGSVKKGKAVKEVLDRLKTDSARKGVVDEAARDTEKMWPREIELIKGLKPEDVVNSVPVSKLRVMMAGASGQGGGAGGGGGKGKGNGGKGGKGGKGSKK